VDLGLRGRVAIVGGASQGIGYGIARLLAAEGARLVVTARRDPALSRAAETIREATGAEVLPVLADVRKAEDHECVVAEAVRRYGTGHVLVNNDGAPPIGRLAGFDDAAWRKAVDQNLMSVVRMVRLVTPHMRQAGGGSIVNITGLSVMQPMIGFGLSVATWGAVVGLAKTLSLGWRPTASPSTRCARASSTPGGSTRSSASRPRTRGGPSTPSSPTWPAASRCAGWARRTTSPRWSRCSSPRAARSSPAPRSPWTAAPAPA
jgi:NAD(P)-dependent dehydrogenase (short-subunit alcohol dehydrogenase family)